MIIHSLLHYVLELLLQILFDDAAKAVEHVSVIHYVSSRLEQIVLFLCHWLSSSIKEPQIY
ncbi:Uncharacterised protein [uncultured archaeon]|nr:Uncharacterised protein [uncultured archaeon]